MSSFRRFVLASIAASAAIALSIVPTSAYAADKACSPGADGVGDSYYPNYGNGGYDVREYELDITYDPRTDRLDGEATISARSTQALCSFNLDLVGLDVLGVEVNRRDAKFTRAGQELIITPRRPILDGRRFEVQVRYSGIPTEFIIPGFGIRSGFMTTDDGVTVAGQPEVAASWFPVNDHPLDKASYKFDVTVPDGYEVVANGFLRDTDRRRGQTTWEWEADEPMASYLATIDVGQWDITESETAGGLPVLDAVDSSLTGGLRDVIDASLARQGEILDFLAGNFGPYPFSTVGAIVESQDDFGFALETQTRPVYTKLFWLDGAGNPVQNDYVVVHELAHQWFGDDIAVARWKDIWLNEGFATYAEWLWNEYEGYESPAEIFRLYDQMPPAEHPFWTVAIADPGVNDLFAPAVYERGALTLQALREEVGDTDFWAIIREWTSSKSGGNATTEEFIALAESVSGRQLDGFFTIWLSTPTKPAFPPAALAGGTADAQQATSSDQTSSTRWAEITRPGQGIRR